jgi:hypothetical protein
MLNRKDSLPSIKIVMEIGMPRGSTRLLQAAFIAALGAPAYAEDGSSRDRAEFDAAAGRLLFQSTSIAEAEPAKPQTVRRSEPSPRDHRQERRTVRVILPSPYGR